MAVLSGNARATRNDFSADKMIGFLRKLPRRALRASLLALAGLTLSAGSLGGGVGFSQCSNDNPTLGNCVWVGGDLNANNSLYFEGMSTAQRMLITGISSGTHTLVFGLQWTKAGKHAYDWITSWDQASAESLAAEGVALTLNECANMTGGNPAACAAAVAGVSATTDVPDEPDVSATFSAGSRDGTGSTQFRINAFETAEGNRTITIKGDGSAFSGVSMTLVGHTSDKSAAVPIANGGDTADTYLFYSLTWTSSSANVLLEFAAHIAIGQDSLYGWGPGNGATAIGGSPYHVITSSFD